MTLDEIVQKIYEERYVDPEHPEIATYMRDGMIREVVQRAFQLTIGDLPVDVVVRIVAAHRARHNITVMRDVSALTDEPAGPTKSSPRLDAVLALLPKLTRVRLSNAIHYAGVFTLTALCANKRVTMKRWKNVGKKCLDDLEQTLATFGHALAETTVRSEENGVTHPEKTGDPA